MSERKKNIIKILLSAVLFLFALLFCEVLFKNLPFWANWAIFMPAYIIVGFDVIIEAIENILKGEFLEEEFLMTIATAGAIIMGFFSEAVFVMLFYTIGEAFEESAENKSKKSIERLLDICPDKAFVLNNGETKEVDAKDVLLDDIILVKPGERIPLDGKIIEGKTSADTSAITGENTPKKLKTGDIAYSGYINLTSPVKISVTEIFKNSTASKIIELCENAREKKTKTERFITRFARIYTPVVVALAVLVAVVPSIIFGNPLKHIYSALTFLVVSCPCALVISVPLSFFGALGAASAKGILVKGSDSLQTFANLQTAVFDKTGTLTEGVFSVTAIHPEVLNESGLLEIAASIERYSNHPIAASITSHYKNKKYLPAENVSEISGKGICATVFNKKIYIGNEKLMNEINANISDCKHSGTVVHIASDGEYLGHIVISDRLKDTAKSGIEKLKSKGIKTIILSGDNESAVKDISEKTGCDDYFYSLLPHEKVEKLEEIMSYSKKATVFTGDGINDAPVLSRADAGIAMGALGSHAAIDSADVVIMDDNIEKIYELCKISKKALRISKENIYLSVFVKISVLILSVFGISGIMWLAAFADVGVLILAVLNSMRNLNSGGKI